MRDDICTIPVTDAFEENDGCPICRMYDTVEKRILEYIMGAAMMEPDVRIETVTLEMVSTTASDLLSCIRFSLYRSVIRIA